MTSTLSSPKNQSLLIADSMYATESAGRVLSFFSIHLLFSAEIAPGG
jgi:hypothetical protein